MNLEYKVHMFRTIGLRVGQKKFLACLILSFESITYVICIHADHWILAQPKINFLDIIYTYAVHLRSKGKRWHGCLRDSSYFGHSRGSRPVASPSQVSFPIPLKIVEETSLIAASHVAEPCRSGIGGRSELALLPA